MSRPRRRRHGVHEEHEPENGERWLLTYSDMITLLLALFIVLFAMSTISQKKFLALALGLRQSFNPKPGLLPASNGLNSDPNLIPPKGINQVRQDLAAPIATSTTTTTTTTTTVPPAAHRSASAPGQQNLDQIAKEINAALAAKGLEQTVSSQIVARGLVVKILADKVFYATDSASLGPVGDEVVDTIASVLRTDTNNIDVEGYTDNQPITGGPYTSNEELSAMRAVNVALRLYRADGIAQARVAATGFGKAHPAAPNTTPANMALNRRIDVVVLAPGQVQP